MYPKTTLKSVVNFANRGILSSWGIFILISEISKFTNFGDL